MHFIKKVMVVISILISINLSAQSSGSFINQFSVSQKNNYSKSISLLPYSSIGVLISSGKSVTVLLQDDDFMNRLSDKDKTLLFVQHDVQAIDNLFANYSIDGLWDIPSISAGITTTNKELSIIDRNGEAIKFSRHLNSFLVVNPKYFEGNILGSQAILQSIFYFL
jgi:hypothetical protein